MRRWLLLLLAGLLSLAPASASAASGDVKLVYGTETSMTVTNLHSLANSATACWQSAVVVNSTDLVEEALIQVVFDPAATAAANSKTFFLFAFSSAGTSFTSTGAASGGTTGTGEGTVTMPDVSTTAQNLIRVASIPYVATDVVVTSSVFSLQQAFGTLPAQWGLVICNHSGAALAASGNIVRYREVYRNVAP